MQKNKFTISAFQVIRLSDSPGSQFLLKARKLIIDSITLAGTLAGNSANHNGFNPIKKSFAPSARLILRALNILWSDTSSSSELISSSSFKVALALGTIITHKRAHKQKMSLWLVI